MMNHLRQPLRLFTLAAPILLCSAADAQAPAEAAAAAAPTPDLPGPPLETNPAVRAALELPRKEPADYFQAIGWLIDLGRPELAKPILEELTKQQLTDVQRAALVGEFGSRSMLQLARTKELTPAGGQFAESCIAAAAAANDPQRIAALVAQLTDPSAEVRELARNDIAATGQTGATATLEALARETDANRRAALLSAAGRLDSLVVGPLLAMLDSRDQSLRADVVNLLAQLDVSQAAPLIQANSASAERALSDAIARYAAGTPPFAPDENNQVVLWRWDDAAKKLAATGFPADEATTIWMARLAQKLVELRPDNRDYQRQALALGIEAAVLYGHSPVSLQSSADSSLLSEVLADALQANYANAATAAADALGRRGDVSVLYTTDAQPAPLAEALVHPNRRVRFAALRVITTLDPHSPYPGSSRVPQALAWFARGTGERRALVAMPTNAAATDLAGKLAALGVEADATNRGRDAVDLARDMADLELILVDMDIQAPGIRQVLYELRVSPTTGQVPVALLAADGRLDAAERLAHEHGRVMAVPRPHSPEVLARIVEQLTNMAGRDAVPADERAAQAAQAATWLEKLAGNKSRPDAARSATPPEP